MISLWWRLESLYVRTVLAYRRAFGRKEYPVVCLSSELRYLWHLLAVRPLWFIVWCVIRLYACTRPKVVLSDDGKGYAESEAALRARGLNPYLTRWMLTGTLEPGKTSVEGYMLHYMHRPDYDRRLHNHPCEWAKSRVLRGRYVERRREPAQLETIAVHNVGDRIAWTAETFHRITDVYKDTWTLFRAGPKHGRGWGFK